MIAEIVTTKKGCSTTMGMAASQARFLGLTARKNNVEYEGQQINQQRTTLSNESANYYNDLLGMSVPVPPSVDDYTKTVYTFADGALTNEITAMIAKTDGTYTISYLRQWTDDFSVINASTSIITRVGSDGSYGYLVGKDQLRTLGKIDGISTSGIGGYEYNGKTLSYIGTVDDQDGLGMTFRTYSDDSSNYYYQYIDPTTSDEYWFVQDPEDPDNIVPMEGEIPSFSAPAASAGYEGNDDYLNTLSNDQLENLIKEEQEYLKLLQSKYGSGDYMVRYVQNTTTEEWNPYFYKASDLTSALYDDNGNSQSNINCYKIGRETKAEEVKAVENCRIEKDSSGRYINLAIPIPNSDEYTNYALTTSTVTDQEKYQDAMNQYEFDKAEYDKAVEDINAKIKIIQAEDRNLELRLKQLDTEQEAIQTEMDAVSQVIQKNTESSFKTFG